MRMFNESVWVEKGIRDANGSGIFCDVRYENEASALHQNGAIMVLIGRSSVLTESDQPSEQQLYESIKWCLENTSAPLVKLDEVSHDIDFLKKFKYFVRNDGSMANLANVAQDLLRFEGMDTEFF